MTEENTEPIEAVTEPIEEPEAAPTEPPVPIKSKKARSDLQLKALEKARQKAYTIRAEKTTIKRQNKSKKSPEVSIELPESQQEVSIDLPNELPENLPENIREDIVKKNPIRRS